MQGAGGLAEVLADLVSLIRADAGVIARVDWQKNRQTNIAVSNNSNGKIWSGGFAHGSALSVFGKTLQNARAGSIWSMSDVEGTVDFIDILEIQNQTYVPPVEILVLCLEGGNSELDLIEIHYRRDPANHNKDLLKILAPELAAAWTRRIPGVGHQIIHLKEASAPIAPDVSPSLLHPSNPSGLSRSEFRICMLIRQGVSVEELEIELNIRKTTLRSHLSSIYSKAHVSGCVELLQLLHREETPEDRLRA